MNVFTYDNEKDYWDALETVKGLGVDCEAQHDELTIVVDELTTFEYNKIIYATSREP